MSLVLNGYTVKRQIYASDSSRVYLANRQVDGVPVALKTLSASEPTAAQLARFEREYAVVRSLDVSGVAKAFDYISGLNGPTMVLEDFAGRSLDCWLNSTASDRPAALCPSVSQIGAFLDLAIEIVGALAQVHQRGFIHRDINPSNVLLEPVSGRTALIDFGLATPADYHSSSVHSSPFFEGTLAYSAPEQTGRINRYIDHRTDYYALGATLFHLASGRPPFLEPDPLATVHAHLTKPPARIDQFNAAVPKAVGDIVCRLLSKTADHRYQSADGILADLETCRQQWQRSASVEPFELARHDRQSRLIIPQTLYGRDRETERLVRAHESVKSGATEVVFVTGEAGVGKSVLINELMPVAVSDGFFASGKFDQFQNAPNRPILQALRSIVQQLLAEPEHRLENHRQELLRVCGPNGRILIDLIPELKGVLGEQPAPPTVEFEEEQNRFNRLLQRFVSVFARAGHPLVLFIDDLQWADRASLRVLQGLLEESNGYLLLVCAYRDGEISASHPLHTWISAVEREGVRAQTVALSSLSSAALSAWLADALYCSRENAKDLCRLVGKNNDANPLLIKQLLQTWADQGALTFDQRAKFWRWNPAHIETLLVTDQIATVLAKRLAKMSPESQRIMWYAASLGSRFSLDTLLDVSELTLAETTKTLSQSIKEGLIEAIGDHYSVGLSADAAIGTVPAVDYRFVHDRVHESAYALLPENTREVEHYHIAQRFRGRYDKTPSNEPLFDAVGHFIAGRACLRRETERDAVAELMLAAGRQAKSAAALDSAREYLETGLALLEDPHWQRRYDLSLAVTNELADVAHLSKDYTTVESCAIAIQTRAKSVVEKAHIQALLIEGHANRLEPAQCLRSGLDFLRQLGVEIPTSPKKWQLLKLYLRIRLQLGGRSIAALKQLPRMRDEKALAALQIMRELIGQSLVVRPELFGYIALTIIALSLRYGHCPISATGYMAYAIMNSLQHDPSRGMRYKELAYHLLAKFSGEHHQPELGFIGDFYVTPWQQHLRDTLTPFQENHKKALHFGDHLFASANQCGFCMASFFCGMPLADVLRSIDESKPVAQRLGIELAAANLHILDQVATRLEGHSNPGRRPEQTFDHEDFVRHHTDRGDGWTLFQYHTFRLIEARYFHDDKLALECLQAGRPFIDHAGSIFALGLFNVFGSLTYLSLARQQGPAARRSLLRKTRHNQRALRRWSDAAPMNFEHKYWLVEAELAYTRRNVADARSAYDRAIMTARGNQFVNDEALTAEMAAKFYIDIGRPLVARHYLQDAYSAYERWGAVAKLRDLAARFPTLMKPSPAALAVPGETAAIDQDGITDLDHLRWRSAVEVASAMSSKLDRASVLNRLMAAILSSSGAERGAYLANRSDDWTVEIFLDENALASAAPGPFDSAAFARIPRAVVDYIKRTESDLFVGNAASDLRFSADPSVLKNNVKSLLGLPIALRGQLAGILYLENNQIENAFYPSQLTLLKWIGLQIALSLESIRFNEMLDSVVHERAAKAREQSRLHQDREKERIDWLKRLSVFLRHEMANKIAALRSSLELIKNHAAESPSLTGYVARAEISLHDIKTLLDQVAEASSLDTALRPKSFTRCDLAVLMREWVEEYSVIYPDTAMKLDCRVDAAAVLGSEFHLRLLADKLVNNAAEHVAQGETVQLGITIDRSHCLFTVQEIGDPLPADIPSMFAPFTSAKRRSHSGTDGNYGLGLYVAKIITEGHSGQIHAAELANPTGAVFTVRLPLA